MFNIKISGLAIVFFSISMLMSCDTCTQPISDSTLYNVWVNYDDDFSDPNTLRSAQNLEANHYGFIIEKDGTFIERKNAGWCGTPPIYYENFDGSWKSISENILEITVEFWGGIDTFKIEILSITESELNINYIYDYD
jgi:hypothetical protein